MIAERVARLRRDAGIRVDPARGPVRLDRFFRELDYRHVAIDGLTLGAVATYLQSKGIAEIDLGDPKTNLAGFIFALGDQVIAFVNGSDILPRRRFSAAHELGHAVLHLGKLADYLKDETIDGSEAGADPKEREANAFAAELLMPAEILEARAEELRRQHGACPRGVLSYRLASELLVSREAMRYRLKTLGVGDDD